jgi:hypothetical protein
LTKIPLKALDVSKGLNLIFAIRRILILNWAHLKSNMSIHLGNLLKILPE